MSQDRLLLEHPAVMGKRRELDYAIEAGRILAYRGLRWVADGGSGEIHYTMVPAAPINFVQTTVSF